MGFCYDLGCAVKEAMKQSNYTTIVLGTVQNLWHFPSRISSEEGEQ
jgi:hypothetical protein